MLRIAYILCFGTCAMAADEPKFKLAAKRDGDKIEATTTDGKTMFTVTSTTGIGEGTIERLGEQWPEAVIIKLPLTGLEKFHVNSGTTTMQASVHAGGMTLREFKKDGKAVEGVDEKHPLWTEIKRVGADGKPGADVPLKKGGHFEVKLPKELLKDNPKSISLEWIDWYRR